MTFSLFLDKSAEKDESFSLELFDPKGGVKLGRLWKTVVTIINDDGKIYTIYTIPYLRN